MSKRRKRGWLGREARDDKGTLQLPMIMKGGQNVQNPGPHAGREVGFRGRVGTYPPTPTTPLSTVPPKLTAEEQAAVDAYVASMTDVLIGVPDSWEGIKPTTYVVATNGLFLVKPGPLGVVARKVDTMPGVKGEVIPGVNFDIPRIPLWCTQHIVAFFRKVCERGKGSLEAYAQIWYSTTEDRWWVEVPPQIVSGGSVEHGANRIPAPGTLHVADVHSHGTNMTAFWSGTDDHDEKHRGQRIFGVIGNVDRPQPSMKWRVSVGDGTFLDVPMGHVAEPPMLTFTVPMDIDAVLFASIMAAAKHWPHIEVPAEWMAAVTERVHVPYNQHQQGHYNHHHGGRSPRDFQQAGGARVTTTAATDLPADVGSRRHIYAAEGIFVVTGSGVSEVLPTGGLH